MRPHLVQHRVQVHLAGHIISQVHLVGQIISKVHLAGQSFSYCLMFNQGSVEETHCHCRMLTIRKDFRQSADHLNLSDPE